MSVNRLKRGDPVIYRKYKYSNQPGPRAKHVHPMQRGEGYDYLVDKFWVVADVSEDGEMLTLQTRRGKTHQVCSSAPELRFPSPWERLWYHSKFPKLTPSS